MPAFASVLMMIDNGSVEAVELVEAPCEEFDWKANKS
jgi:hypothetical protein